VLVISPAGGEHLPKLPSKWRAVCFLVVLNGSPLSANSRVAVPVLGQCPIRTPAFMARRLRQGAGLLLAPHVEGPTGKGTTFAGFFQNSITEESTENA